MQDELERSFRDDHDRLVAVARRVLGPGPDVEDCVQDAYLAALEHERQAAVAVEHPRAWLAVVSRRRAVDLVRKEARARAALPRVASRTDLGQQPAPEDQVLDSIEAAHLVAKLGRLPLMTQQVVDLVARGATPRDAAR